MNRQIQSAHTPFQFTPQNQAQLQHIIARYPDGRAQSTVIAALDLAQRQHQGWLSREAIEEVAKQLAMPEIRVYEIASFYTMFNLQPVGRYHLQVCTTTPCWLRGSDDVLSACHNKRQQYGETVFTVTEVECLGACVDAPILQVNDDYHENLDGSMTEALLDGLAQEYQNQQTVATLHSNIGESSQPELKIHTKARARAKTELDAAVQTLSGVKVKTKTPKANTTKKSTTLIEKLGQSDDSIARPKTKSKVRTKTPEGEQ